jgi:hypothetical protein
MLTVLDSLKQALATTPEQTQVRIQLGENGSIFEIAASDLMTALGVTPIVQTPAKTRSVQVSPANTYLRIREAPSASATQVGQYSNGAVFDIIDATPVVADNHQWVQTADGKGWIALDLTVTPNSTGPVTATPWTLPFTAQQRGVGASAGGWALETRHFAIVQNSRIEVMLFCCYEAGQAAKVVPAMRNLGVKQFILRAAAHEKPTTPQRFADLTLPILQEYAAQLGSNSPLLIAIHNEPNLAQEGWGSAWADGTAFATWWQSVAGLYRSAFPTARLGFPALSPGGDVPNIRLNESAFLSGAASAIQAADWIGVHYYWAAQDGSDINPPFAQWKSWFGAKPIVGTEVGPTDANTVTADAVRKAYQAFGSNGVPAMAWLLTGAGAWHNAAWDEHGIIVNA